MKGRYEHPKAKRETPNEAEELFLSLAYNRFYDIWETVFSDNFWNNDETVRFSLIKDAISIYAELLNYEPIKWYHDHMKNVRPPMEAELSEELLKFIRNVIAHFPFYTSWNDVYINKIIVNWLKHGQSIDRFLLKYSGKESIKYRYWRSDTKTMSYIEIKFPEYYGNDNIFLKDIISDKEGVEFLLILMRRTMDSQVESWEKAD